MIINQQILDELSAKAKENPRLRCNLDMRNYADDQLQRMLNALEPGAEVSFAGIKETRKYLWFMVQGNTGSRFMVHG